jgi:DNA-binding Lrp family transcriptional regulator
MKQVAMNGKKRMTVREVAEVLGCTPETVKKHIRELFPNMLQKGKTTYLTEAQVTVVLESMKKGQAYAHHVTGGNVATYNSGIVGAETGDTLYLQVAMKEREAKELWRRDRDDMLSMYRR